MAIKGEYKQVDGQWHQTIAVDGPLGSVSLSGLWPQDCLLEKAMYLAGHRNEP